MERDPICIPHQFKTKQDIEISGFFAALFSWGKRSSILKNCRDLLERMDNRPYDFIMAHSKKDLENLISFKHRTFNSTDLLFFIEFFHQYYSTFQSLESAFSAHMEPTDSTIEKALGGFHHLIFSGDHPPRTRKHISSPDHHSACKRLNMFLRWMVREDDQGVDFGIWKEISPSQLVCPMDVHVFRVAQKLQLISSHRVNWKAALELTDYLRTLDPIDPVRYDFALFGLGIEEHF
ncbi:MAG: TIGR02757 family protein [Chitinophagaceae bacterium]